MGDTSETSPPSSSSSASCGSCPTPSACCSVRGSRNPATWESAKMILGGSHSYWNCFGLAGQIDRGSRYLSQRGQEGNWSAHSPSPPCPCSPSPSMSGTG